MIFPVNKLNGLESREHILDSQANSIRCSLVSHPTMSDDDRAAKAARAKALVRLSYSEGLQLTSPSLSSTKRGSKRNLVLFRTQVPALARQ